MTLEFLTTSADLVASSPFEHDASEAGARFEARDGWNLAVSYGEPADEARACRESVAWADTSHLGKIEVQARASAPISDARRARREAGFCR